MKHGGSRRLVFFSAGLLAAGLWAAALAEAQVEPIITFQYYPVTPEAGRSLHQQLFADTPLRHEGRKVAGWARSPIRYDFKFRSAPAIGLCRISSLEVTCHCEVTLPRLNSEDPGLKSDFNAYLALLKEHELTHCRISAAHAGRFKEAVLALGDRPCTGLKDEVRSIFGQMREELKRDQNLFDDNTRLGGYQSRIGGIFLNLPPRSQAPAGGREGLGNLPEPDKDAFWGGPASGDPETGAIYKDKDGVWRNY